MQKRQWFALAAIFLIAAVASYYLHIDGGRSISARINDANDDVDITGFTDPPLTFSAFGDYLIYAGFLFTWIWCLIICVSFFTLGLLERKENK